MTLDEFIAKYNGTSVDADHAYGAQCVDLVKLWEAENGWPITNGNAKDQFKDWAGYEKIANTPTGVPRKGDIVIWGTEIGAYGHIAIFVEGDVNSFRSFDQNWPVGSPCKIVSHTYKGVLGWLRRISPPAPPAPPTPEKEIVYVDKIVEVDKQSTLDELKRLQNLLASKEEDITTFKSERDIALRSLETRTEELKTCNIVREDLLKQKSEGFGVLDKFYSENFIIPKNLLSKLLNKIFRS